MCVAHAWTALMQQHCTIVTHPENKAWVESYGISFKECVLARWDMRVRQRGCGPSGAVYGRSC